MLAMTDFYLKLLFVRGRTRKPMNARKCKIIALFFITVIVLRDVNNIFGNIFLHNIPRAARKSNSLALSDGVVPKSFMGTKFVARFKFNQIAKLSTEVVFYKVAKFYFSQKANPLTVFSSLVRKVKLFC